MESETYDRIVIGAGIMGSSTAYNLSKSGYKTLLLEQFPLDHSNGSSHGGSRIIRKSYENQCYVQWMDESYQAWEDIEKQANQTLKFQTGFTVLEEKPYAGIAKLVKNLDQFNIAYTILSHEEFQKKFPQLSFPKEIWKFYEPTGGVLLADKCKAAILDLCKKHNTRIIENCAVLSIQPGNEVTIHTDKGDFRGSSVVICAGIWTKNLMQQLDLELPIQPERAFVYYWKEKEKGSTSVERIPCLKINNSKGYYYSCPSLEYPGYMKVAQHRPVPCSVETMDEIKTDPHFTEMKNFIKCHFPALDYESCFQELCMYSKTSDLVAIIDHHPKHRNIVYAAGFSGTGFKKGPVVGRILADMSSDKDPGVNMDAFKLSRFAQN